MGTMTDRCRIAEGQQFCFEQVRARKRPLRSPNRRIARAQRD